MNQTQKDLRASIEYRLDALEMNAFNQGFEAATNGLDELSNTKHNDGDEIAAEVLRWAAKELRGENC